MAETTQNQFDTVGMYAEGRDKQFIEAFQQETSELKNYASVEQVGNVAVHLIPTSGTREFGFRNSRKEEINATDDSYGWRAIRPVIMDDWAELNTLDPHFLDNLPINLTRIAVQQGKAAARATDSILIGSCTCTTTSSVVNGEKIIRKYDYITGAQEKSLYKGGTTSGIFGDAYEGKYGDVVVPIKLNPLVVGNDTPLSNITDYTSSSVLNLAKTPVIPVNYVKTGSPEVSGYKKEKLIAAITALRSRHAKGQLVACMTHKQALDILNDPEMQSVLYGYQVLKNGMPDTIMGCKLLITDQLPLVKVGDRWVRACPVYHRDDLVYGIWDDVRFEVKEPGNLKSTIYAGATMMMGATRRRDDAFINILCDEGIVETSQSS